MATDIRMARLGDTEVEIKRLGTRNALRVGRQLLEYIKLVSAHWDTLSEAAQTKDVARRTQIGFEFVEILAAELDTDNLLEMLANLIGVDVNVVGEAPLEDTLDAVALAFKVNDMPALVTAAGKVVKAAIGLFNQVRGQQAQAPTEIGRAARRRAAKVAPKAEPVAGGDGTTGGVELHGCQARLQRPAGGVLSCEGLAAHGGEHSTDGIVWSEIGKERAPEQPQLGTEH